MATFQVWTGRVSTQIDANSPLNAALFEGLSNDILHLRQAGYGNDESAGTYYTPGWGHTHNQVDSPGIEMATASISFDSLKRLKESLFHSKAYTSIVGFYGSMETLTGGGGGTDTYAVDADGAWARFGGTVGSTSHLEYESGGITQGRHNPILRMHIKTHSNIDERRMYFGFKEDAGVISTDSTPDVELAAFRYATDVDGTPYWRCISINGTGASAQETTTSVAIAINTAYILEVRVTSSKVTFYINGNLVATHETTIPDSATSLEVTLLARSLQGAENRLINVATVHVIREAA